MENKSTRGILGVQKMRVDYGEPGDAVLVELDLVAVPGYDPHHLLGEAWQDLFPGAAVIPCGHCGQWAARRTECKHCGAAVD